MKTLRFLGWGLLIAAGLCLIAMLGTLFMAAITPWMLAPGVPNPMYAFWFHLVARLFLATIFLAVPGLLILGNANDGGYAEGMAD